MGTRFTVGLVFAVICASCGGEVHSDNSGAANGAGGSSSGPSSSTSPGASATSTATSSPPSGPPGNPPVGPAIVIDATATQGTFTAIAAGDFTPLAIANSVVDSSGLPTDATNIFVTTPTTRVVAKGASIGIPSALVVQPQPNDDPNWPVAWIDGLTGNVNESFGSTSTLATGAVGNVIVQTTTDLYVESAAGNCVATIKANALSCAGLPFFPVFLGGNGFFANGSAIYSADATSLYVSDAQGHVTTTALPIYLTSCKSGGCVYDLAPDNAGNVFLVGEGGIFAYSDGAFIIEDRMSIAHQIIIDGTTGYVLMSDEGSPALLSFPTNQNLEPGELTTDITLSTRFAVANHMVYWISADGKSVMHTSVQ